MFKTVLGIALLVLGALVLEFVTLDQGWPTISTTVKYLGLHWNPFVIYVWGVLGGHFFLDPSWTFAQYIGEWGELALVVWVGWGLFWVFYGRHHVLPLSTTERLILIVLSIALGALGWTIESDVTFLV